MKNDLEAAWPLTGTDPGYYPTGSTSSSPKGLAPMPSPSFYAPSAPTGQSSRPMSAGVLLAALGIILGTAIPLTAIGVSMMGFFGLIVVWAGIIIVSALAFNRLR